MYNFIILGPPGSGKGTQSEYLVKKFGFIHISTGDIIRNNIIKKTSLGISCRKYLEQGKLVPDYIIIKIIEKYLRMAIGNLIWDGFPRTIMQAKKLDKLLQKINRKINRVFYLKIDEKKIINRITGRLICLICNHIYHKIWLPPKISYICDYDQSKLIQRKDDNEEKIKIRLMDYYFNIKHLIKYYLNKKVLTVINANIEEKYVWNQISTILK